MTKLKELRVKSGVTREKFSELAGVPLPRLEKHEQGMYEMKLTDAKAYSETLGKLLKRTPSRILVELSETVSRGDPTHE